MLKLLARHRTKLLGYAIVFLGAIQAAAPQLIAVLTPKVYNLLMIGAGIVAALIGHANTRAGK